MANELGTYDVPSQDEVDVRVRELEQTVARLNAELAEREDTERLQQARLDRLQRLVDGQPALICEFLPDLTLSFVNQGYADYFGMTREALTGYNFLNLVPEAEREGMRAHYASMGPGNDVEVIVHEVVLPSGEIRWQEWTDRAFFNADGTVTGFQSIGRDITERNRVEEERAQLNIAIEHAMQGISHLDTEGTFTMVRHVYATQLGYDTPEELLGCSWAETVPPEDHHLGIAAVQRMLQVGQAEEELRGLRKDGSIFYKHLLLIKRTNTEGDHIGHFCFMRDITERMEAEVERGRMLQELEMRNAELERFVYTVSHDLKAPLVTIKGFLGYVKEDAQSNDLDQLDRDITRIASAADSMTRLLNELLDLSRVGRQINPSQVVSLWDLVSEAALLAKGGLDRRGVILTIEPDMPRVEVEVVRVVETFQNLIDNAVKFMGDQPSPRIDITATVQGPAVVCRVRDNGIGVDPSYQEKIFGLFERLDQDIDGTGIGLALVRRIVELHEGQVWVESDGLGHGSTFCFTLPFADAG